MAVHGHAPGPEGTPTVLLYCHYDVQPPLGEDAWTSPIWELTERDGRWYGRGSADCKGNIVMHLTALRALREVDGGFPCSVKLICEGSEEQGTGGLEAFVPENADLLRADTILVVDTGNFAVGVPTLTTHPAGHDQRRRHRARARQRDALRHVRRTGARLARGTRSRCSPRCTTSAATPPSTASTRRQTWQGVEYSAEQFRQDANVLDGVQLMGDGTRRRPALGAALGHDLGIDVPP